MNLLTRYLPAELKVYVLRQMKPNDLYNFIQAFPDYTALFRDNFRLITDDIYNPRYGHLPQIWELPPKYSDHLLPHHSIILERLLAFTGIVLVECHKFDSMSILSLVQLLIQINNSELMGNLEFKITIRRISNWIPIDHVLTYLLDRTGDKYCQIPITYLALPDASNYFFIDSPKWDPRCLQPLQKASNLVIAYGRRYDYGHLFPNIKTLCINNPLNDFDVIVSQGFPEVLTLGSYPSSLKLTPSICENLQSIRINCSMNNRGVTELKDLDLPRCERIVISYSEMYGRKPNIACSLTNIRAPQLKCIIFDSYETDLIIDGIYAKELMQFVISARTFTTNPQIPLEFPELHAFFMKIGMSSAVDEDYNDYLEHSSTDFRFLQNATYAHIDWDYPALDMLNMKNLQSLILEQKPFGGYPETVWFPKLTTLDLRYNALREEICEFLFHAPLLKKFFDETEGFKYWPRFTSITESNVGILTNEPFIESDDKTIDLYAVDDLYFRNEPNEEPEEEPERELEEDSEQPEEPEELEEAEEAEEADEFVEDDEDDEDDEFAEDLSEINLDEDESDEIGLDEDELDEDAVDIFAGELVDEWSDEELSDEELSGEEISDD